MSWIYEDIIIDFRIPSGIQQVIDELERANREKDFGAWFNHIDLLDVVCKNTYAAGYITEKQWNTLCRKYTLDLCFKNEE